jgi:preprotein translocase subunit SecF
MKTEMRQLIKATHIDFLGRGRQALMVSGVMVLVCLLSLATRGLNLGLDFTGGTLIEVGYPAPVEIPEVRDMLSEAGFAEAQAQHFGTASDVLIRIAPREGMNSAAVSSQVLGVLKAANTAVEMRRVEYVGPTVGDELIEDGGLAMLFALIAILIYVTLRFEWRLALGTTVAIVHDVIITLGIFSLFQLEFDLTVLAAVLAVIGYSVNDTVVVLDRIRENFRKMRKGGAIQVMNVSINETLSRTLMTSLTTLVAVVVLFFLGGPAIHNFSLALIIGIVVGTYSSIYVASSSALLLGVNREDLLPRAKTEVDDRP